MTERLMFDSADVRNLVNIKDEIPHDALIAGYVDGRYDTFPTLHHHFPDHTRVSITVTGDFSANVCDVEAGDLTPDHGARWAKGEHGAGRHPTLYMPESLWDDCKEAVRAHGLNPDKDVSWWVAWKDHDGPIPDGAVALQYRLDTPQRVDVSKVRDYWPGVDPKPEEEPQHHDHTPAHDTPEGWTARMIHNLPVLRHGAHGPDVRTAQGLLQARGFHHVDIDGINGHDTTDAVHALQEREGIDSDGVIGRDTWAVLITGSKA